MLPPVHDNYRWVFFSGCIFETLSILRCKIVRTLRCVQRTRCVQWFGPQRARVSGGLYEFRALPVVQFTDHQSRVHYRTWGYYTALRYCRVTHERNSKQCKIMFERDWKRSVVKRSVHKVWKQSLFFIPEGNV